MGQINPNIGLDQRINIYLIATEHIYIYVESCMYKWWGLNGFVLDAYMR